MADQAGIRKVAVIGNGSMGGNMALLLASNGIHVSLNDPSEDSMARVIANARHDNLDPSLLSTHTDHASLCASLDEKPRIILFSLPHGTTGDTVLEELKPHLERDDLIIDASNEHWANTERRQAKLVSMGVYYIGCGVSGGYQAARRGPSMCPGGEDRALDLAMPLFEIMAAKDRRGGRPCTGRCGMGGSGHYVKMVHNGIEHGMMSAQAEAWQIMEKGLGMSFDEIAEVFRRWNEEGELKDTFLIEIGAEICRQRNEKGKHVLSDVEDKVVQDIDGSEGTGVWTSEEAIRLHIPAPTLSDAHYVRLASAFRQDRRETNTAFGGSSFANPTAWSSASGSTEDEKRQQIEDLRKAVYCVFLCSFAQGINIIDHVNREKKWQIDFGAVAQIWRDGCIIRCGRINDLMTDIFTPANPNTNTDTKSSTGGSQDETTSLPFQNNPSIAADLKSTFPHLRSVVARAVEHDAIVPSMSATLEWLKYSTGTELPTQFYEAQLDFFGKHMFDVKGEETGKAVTGVHHFEWRAP